jgi:hypothetical protein
MQKLKREKLEVKRKPYHLQHTTVFATITAPTLSGTNSKVIQILIFFFSSRVFALFLLFTNEK